jgi:HrpA-like RNA helicase
MNRCEEPGDVLVFLTGELEIETACTQIRSECAQFAGSETIGEVYDMQLIIITSCIEILSVILQNDRATCLTYKVRQQ